MWSQDMTPLDTEQGIRKILEHAPVDDLVLLYIPARHDYVETHQYLLESWGLPIEQVMRFDDRFIPDPTKIYWVTDDVLETGRTLRTYVDILTAAVPLEKVWFYTVFMYGEKPWDRLDEASVCLAYKEA